MKLITITCAALLSSSLLFQSNPRTVFGAKISYQSNGSMVNLVAYIHNGRYLTNKKILSKRDFCFFASGEWPSIYNPERINYFEENNVLGGIYVDSITNEKIPYCFALDSLWKVRFRQYPFRGLNEFGWSQSAYRPSLPQEKYLYERYGIEQIDTHFFLDTSFWKLLRDVMNPIWVGEYKRVD